MSKLAELAAGGTITVDAEGGSMFPLIRHGDSVIVRAIDRPLRVGDIVLVVIDRRWVLHRIVKLRAGEATTQGDNQAVRDSAVRLAAVLGIVERVAGSSLRLEWPPVGLNLWRSIGPFRRRATVLAAALRRRVD